MAHPRWVLSETVDSVAMIKAYQKWCRENPAEVMQLGLDEGLPIICHYPTFKLAEPGVFKTDCPRGGLCKRCHEERGGFTFRWFSRLWLEEYELLRGPGRWSPGVPEGFQRQHHPAFAGQVIDSQGYLVGKEYPHPRFADLHDHPLQCFGSDSSSECSSESSDEGD